MKYIRTKDGIYKLIEIRKNEYRMLNVDGSIHLAHYEPEDYKIADTIEELCDELVSIEEPGNHMFYCNNLEQVFKYYTRYKEKYGIEAIYGAIWTDKGLIYVAKMNDEGELELICANT